MSKLSNRSSPERAVCFHPYIYHLTVQNDWWKYSSAVLYNKVVKMNSLAVFCACLLMMGCVRSTPVYPNAPLGHLSTVDVCLFMCNICFDDMDSAMMDCVNKVCLNKTQFEINLYLIKLGRTCKNYSKIDSTMFGNESD